MFCSITGLATYSQITWVGRSTAREWDYVINPNRVIIPGFNLYSAEIAGIWGFSKYREILDSQSTSEAIMAITISTSQTWSIASANFARRYLEVPFTYTIFKNISRTSRNSAHINPLDFMYLGGWVAIFYVLCVMCHAISSFYRLFSARLNFAQWFWINWMFSIRLIYCIWITVSGPSMVVHRAHRSRPGYSLTSGYNTKGGRLFSHSHIITKNKLVCNGWYNHD